ncbi:hypothetical protein [Streptomyces sp. RP5T]|uniref:hypothetical protein n=1 Tax=Streptomyces sp. RP5T TaxID=2490848 RepID=UPI000F64AF66|nr:hypothetical protein [Streptomyces sp. RP5T]RRR74867.1 hypothetical protein EHS43_34510 [Streptomyces sp. RP5T]
MTGRSWPRRVRADHKSVAADGNIQDSTISSDSHVTHINEVHIHPAPGATEQGTALSDIAAVLADLRDRTGELAAEQVTQARQLAALEHRQTTGPTTALTDLQHHNAELTGRLRNQAERLRAVEDRLDDQEARSSAAALTDLQRQSAELSARFATQADQLAALERRRDTAPVSAAEAERLRAEREWAAARAHADQYAAERDEARRRLAALPPREGGEPATTLSSAQQYPTSATTGRQGRYAPSRLLDRSRDILHPSPVRPKRIHSAYKKVGGTKLLVVRKTCSSRWCLRCVREQHGRALGAVIGPVGLLASLAAAIGLFRAGAPWWIGLPVVAGLFFGTPFLVDWVERSTPRI